MDRRQTSISAPRSNTALFFQVIEEAKDKRRIQIHDRQVGRCFLQASLGKGDEETEGVSVRGDGVRAGTALAHESVGKIGLQQLGEGGVEFSHRRRLSARSHRSVASLNSSGAAERYQ